MSLDALIERTLRLAEEHDHASRGRTTLDEQRTRRREVFDLRRQLKAIDHPDATDVLEFASNVLMLENFSLSIPEGVNVRPLDELKKKEYGSGPEKELRVYWSPHFEDLDVDSLNVVVALTPPGYVQPFHAHLQTEEFTLNTEGKLDLMTYAHGVPQDLIVPKGHIGRSPAGLAHTLRNPNTHRSANVSAKVPQSMNDRHDISDVISYHVNSPGPSVIAPETDSAGGLTIHRHELQDADYSYEAELMSFRRGAGMQLRSDGVTDFYFVTEGAFLVKHGNDARPLEQYGLLTIDPGERAMVEAVEDGSTLYSIKF